MPVSLYFHILLCRCSSMLRMITAMEFYLLGYNAVDGQHGITSHKIELSITAMIPFYSAVYFNTTVKSIYLEIVLI
jgi:hypothetical protein